MKRRGPLYYKKLFILRKQSGSWERCRQLRTKEGLRSLVQQRLIGETTEARVLREVRQEKAAACRNRTRKLSSARADRNALVNVVLPTPLVDEAGPQQAHSSARSAAWTSNNENATAIEEQAPKRNSLSNMAVKHMLEHGPTILEEEIQLGEKINAGGCGVIYKAIYKGQLVVVKKAHTRTRRPGLCAALGSTAAPSAYSSVFEDTLISEAAVMYKLASTQSEYLVMYKGLLVDACKQPQGLLMEYADCGSLASLLKTSQNPQSPEYVDDQQLLGLLLDVASGMVVLHKANIAHLDVKYENILVSHSDGVYRAKVGDFGLHVINRTELMVLPLRGTKRIMAPEQWRALATKPIDPFKVDVWMFGILMYDTLKRGSCLAFDNMDPHLRPWSQASGYEPPLPIDWDPELVSLIRSCLSVYPWYRPSFSKIVLELKQIMQHMTNT